MEPFAQQYLKWKH